MEEIDLKELISMFMKRKILIILVVIIFGLIGAIYTVKFITPTYKSTTKLLLVQTGEKSNVYENTGSITTTDLTLNSKLVNNYRDIATSESVLSKVIQNLNLNIGAEELKNMTSVTVKTDTEILQLTVEYTDPEMTCNIAKEIANVFIETVNRYYKLDNLNVLDEAKVNLTPSNVHLTKNVIIFAFIGAILVSGYILLVNMLDTTVKSDTDIEKALEVPVLASIVFTNENAKKTVQKQADDLYKMSGFDSSIEHNTVENESIFENYTDEELLEEENEKEEIEENERSFNYNRSRKHKRNKSKNRRNG